MIQIKTDMFLKSVNMHVKSPLTFVAITPTYTCTHVTHTPGAGELMLLSHRLLENPWTVFAVSDTRAAFSC